MVHPSRRSFIKKASVAVTSTGLIGAIVGTQRRYSNNITIGMAPTTQKYIKDQPKMRKSEGEVWAVLFDDKSSLRENVYINRVHPRVRSQIKRSNDGFWVMGAAVLPNKSEFNLISNSMDINNRVVKYRAAQSDSSDTSSKDLRYHYELEKWSPKVPVIRNPKKVQVEWKSNPPEAR